MSLKIIYPNENKMKTKDLKKIKEKLDKLLLKNLIKKIDKLNDFLGKIQGYLLVADQKNLIEYFNYFCELNFLDVFNSFFEKGIESITFSILQMISFLTINIQNQELIEYIYRKRYSTNIPGQNMNLIDKLISLDTKKNEEYLTYQINFIKSLTLRIKINTLNYFYDCNINQFPILTKSLSLYNYNDPLIRNVVKNIFCAIIKIENKNLREFLISFPINLYYSNIIFQLKNTIIRLCSINLNDDNCEKNFRKLQKEHDFIIDIVYYIADLIKLNIEKINFILINCLLNEIILPLIYVIINKEKNNNITIYHSLYMLCLFLFTNNNDFIYNIITYFLFCEKIQKDLYTKLSSSTFSNVNSNLMDTINFLITNNLYADINEHSWQKIKEYMKNSTGTDLSTGEIDYNNIYEICQNLVKVKVENAVIQNPIYEFLKNYFICNDDNIILILNLIVNSSIKYYINLQNNIFSNNNNKEDYEKNVIVNKEEEVLKIKSSYNIFNNKYFQIDLKEDESEFILNSLFHNLSSVNVFRLATYEIILTNMQLLIKFILEKNDNKPEYKKNFIEKLIKAIDEQFLKMDKLIKSDKTLNKYLFDSCLKAYEHYIKNIDKKINDIVTLPNILVPIIYLDKLEEIPEYLRENKTNNECLRNYIFNIFFINDIINDLVDNKNEIIKSKRFPIQIETIKFSLGKEYTEDQLGQDYIFCKILRNNNYIECKAIVSSDTIYFGGMMTENSTIKIFKKIPLRYLEINNGENNCILNIIDKTNKINEKNILKIDCLNDKNTLNVYNFLIQHILFCLNLEESLFISYMEEMKKNLHTLLL